MPYQNPQALVSSQQLSESIGNPNLIILDSSYHLPNVDRNAVEEFKEKHIEGAFFFDIDVVCDPDSDLPHMLPPPELFAKAAGDWGISNNTHVVVYDVYGMQSAARAWWMFRVYGHDNVSVLNGGLPKWEKDGYSLSSSLKPPVPAEFKPKYRRELVRDLADIFDLIETNNENLVDVRSLGRFKGDEPEPREGMRSGHMPGATNLPFTELLSPEDKTFLPADKLKEKLYKTISNTQNPVVTTCGSGVTACILALALFLIGKEDVAVYDGSWSEWGSLSHTPIVQ